MDQLNILYSLIDQLNEDDFSKLETYVQDSRNRFNLKNIINNIKFKLDPNNNEGHKIAYYHHVDVSRHLDETIGCLRVPFNVIIEAYDIKNFSDAHTTDVVNNHQQPGWVNYFDYEINEEDLKSLKLKKSNHDYTCTGIGDPAIGTGIVDIFIYYHKIITEDGPYAWIKDDGSVMKVQVKDGRLFNLSNNLISDGINNYCLSWSGD